MSIGRFDDTRLQQSLSAQDSAPFFRAAGQMGFSIEQSSRQSITDALRAGENFPSATEHLAPGN